MACLIYLEILEARGLRSPEFTNLGKTIICGLLWICQVGGDLKKGSLAETVSRE
jgi:hypothetical protein